MKWNEQSKGLGDTIKKITSATKLDKLAEKIAEVAGADDCGCDERQDKLNKMFPYKVQGQPGSVDSVPSVKEETEKHKRLKRKFQKRV